VPLQVYLGLRRAGVTSSYADLYRRFWDVRPTLNVPYVLAGHMILPWVSTPTVTLLGSGCAMVVMAVSLPDKGRWLRRPSGRTTLRRICGDRLLSGHVRSAGARLEDDRSPGRQLAAKAPGQ
jgi:hypothetical protein